MPAVDEHEGAIVEHGTKRLGDVWSGFTHFADGDVIFAKITPCMENGKAAVARELHGGMACGSTEFHVLRPTEAMLADYLWRFLRQRSFRAGAEAAMTGAVGQRRVPRAYIEEHRVPVPPLAEQRRIVAKLDRLSAKRSAAEGHLARISKLAARAKQSILAAAFRGDLTAEWRTEHATALKDSIALRDTLAADRGTLSVDVKRKPREIPSDNHRVRIELALPEEWCASNLEEISSPLRLIQY